MAQSIIETPDWAPTWVVRKFEKLARIEGLGYYEFLNKYDPEFDPDKWDNDPASPEQAWAGLSDKDIKEL